jgi:hypothetical protein
VALGTHPAIGDEGGCVSEADDTSSPADHPR